MAEARKLFAAGLYEELQSFKIGGVSKIDSDGVSKKEGGLSFLTESRASRTRRVFSETLKGRKAHENSDFLEKVTAACEKQINLEQSIQSFVKKHQCVEVSPPPSRFFSYLTELCRQQPDDIRASLQKLIQADIEDLKALFNEIMILYIVAEAPSQVNIDYSCQTDLITQQNKAPLEATDFITAVHQIVALVERDILQEGREELKKVVTAAIRDQEPLENVILKENEATIIAALSERMSDSMLSDKERRQAETSLAEFKTTLSEAKSNEEKQTKIGQFCIKSAINLKSGDASSGKLLRIYSHLGSSTTPRTHSPLSATSDKEHDFFKRCQTEVSEAIDLLKGLLSKVTSDAERKVSVAAEEKIATTVMDSSMSEIKEKLKFVVRGAMNETLAAMKKKIEIFGSLANIGTSEVDLKQVSENMRHFSFKIVEFQKTFDMKKSDYIKNGLSHEHAIYIGNVLNGAKTSFWTVQEQLAALVNQPVEENKSTLSRP